MKFAPDAQKDLKKAEAQKLNAGTHPRKSSSRESSLGSRDDMSKELKAYLDRIVDEVEESLIGRVSYDNTLNQTEKLEIPLPLDSARDRVTHWLRGTAQPIKHPHDKPIQFKTTTTKLRQCQRRLPKGEWPGQWSAKPTQLSAKVCI